MEASVHRGPEPESSRTQGLHGRDRRPWRATARATIATTEETTDPPPARRSTSTMMAYAAAWLLAAIGSLYFADTGNNRIRKVSADWHHRHGEPAMAHCRLIPERCDLLRGGRGCSSQFRGSWMGLVRSLYRGHLEFPHTQDLDRRDCHFTVVGNGTKATQAMAAMRVARRLIIRSAHGDYGWQPVYCGHPLCSEGGPLTVSHYARGILRRRTCRKRRADGNVLVAVAVDSAGNVYASDHEHKPQVPGKISQGK